MTQSDFDRPVFSAVAGIISAGKTTLTKQLAEAMNADAYFEPVKENEYLTDFYNDKAKYGFAMQVYLLHKRFGQHQQVVWTMDAEDRWAVQDRTIYEDSIFAEMLCEADLMDRRDFRNYLELFKKMSNFLQKPDVILYLVVSPETAMQRMLDRGRPSEKIGVSLDYLRSLEEHYERWFERMIRPPRALNIVKVPWENFNDTESMVRLIEEQTGARRKDTDRWGRKF